MHSNWPALIIITVQLYGGANCYAYCRFLLLLLLLLHKAIFSLLLLIYLKFINYHVNEFSVFFFFLSHYRTYVRIYAYTFISIHWVFRSFYCCCLDVIYVIFCLSWSDMICVSAWSLTERMRKRTCTQPGLFFGYRIPITNNISKLWRQNVVQVHKPVISFTL